MNDTKTQLLSGSVVLRPGAEIIGVGGLFEVGAPCGGDSALTDSRYFSEDLDEIRDGGSVTVSNETREVVAVTELTGGTWTALPTGTNLSDHVCTLSWSAEAPEASFYGVSIAQRQSVQFEGSEAASGAADIVIEDD